MIDLSTMNLQLSQLLTDQSILILGLGKEGLSSYQTVRRLFPQTVIGLADKKTPSQLSPVWSQIKRTDKHLAWHLGQSYLNSASKYGLIIKSPGIKPSLVPARYRSRLTSQAKLFFHSFPGQIIAVTGTKGKSTTASLVYHCLKPLAGKHSVHLLGNIGHPLLSAANYQPNKHSLAVCELSSFQTGTLDRSPNISVMLEFYPEHLDYYPDAATYYQAKLNLLSHTNPDQITLAPAGHSQLTKLTKLTRGRLIIYGPQSRSASCQHHQLYLANQHIIRTNKLPLVGRFNYLNCLPAILIAHRFGLKNSQIASQLASFSPLPHRLEKIGTYQSITFINDSLATIPQATINALNSLKQVATLITGGLDRGLNYQSLAVAIASSTVKNLILFPNTDTKIIRHLTTVATKSQPTIHQTKSMASAVKLAYQLTPPNSICLLSPAAASFNLFTNYADRGEQYQKYIKQFANQR